MSNGVAGWEPPRLCAKLPIVPMVRCWVVCRVEAPLTGRLKFQFAAPPAVLGPSISLQSVSSNHEPQSAGEVFVPNFPFGNRAEANVAFRACACCGAGNPDMPRSGCGPGPNTRAQGVSMIFTFSYQSAHALGQRKNVSGRSSQKCLGRK